MSAMDHTPSVAVPMARRPEELGLSMPLVEDLILRRVVHETRTTMQVIADHLCVGTSIVEAVIRTMRDRKLVEFDGLEGRDYVVVPTDAGRSFCDVRSRECSYSGPIPVPLSQYCQVVAAQIPTVQMDRARLTNAFSDLVLSGDLIAGLGPAIHSEGAMFLYGPPGTGKTSIAERLVRAYESSVLIPYCVEVEGRIITVFDPTVHEATEDQPGPDLDQRYVRCLRPAVVTGGELHPGMLDLHRDPETGVYFAPLQMKANNGVLVIDDFGRQSMTPAQLLNRWIVPLDRHVDYLSLAGRKIEVPFEMKVVLSTNLDPASLGDEAFFRRIRNKIYVGAIDDEQFDWILSRVVQAKGYACGAQEAAHLREVARDRGDGDLRAYLPAMVVEMAQAVIRFESLPPALTVDLIDRVLNLYFTRFESESTLMPAPV